jgi:Cu2+-exporting ATPase
MDHAAHASHAAPAAPSAEHAAHAGHAMPAAARAAPTEDHSAHGGRPGMTAVDMERDMRNRFFLSFVLTVPVFLFSHLATQILGLHIPLPFGIDDKLFGFILTTPVVLYGAWPFYVGARNGLRQGALNMSVLVALSVLTGYLFSVAATFLFDGEVFYEAAAMLVTFMLFGHWMEMRARGAAGPGHPQQDETESRVGSRLQWIGDPDCRRAVVSPVRHFVATSHRRVVHVGVVHSRSRECGAVEERKS